MTSPTDYSLEKRIFTNTYNDSLQIGAGKVYVQNLTGKRLHLYSVYYGGGGGPQELQNIEPSTFVEIDEEPDYFFQEPPPKVFVSRKKGDNKPERKTVLDVLK